MQAMKKPAPKAEKNCVGSPIIRVTNRRRKRRRRGNKEKDKKGRRRGEVRGREDCRR